MPILFVHWLAQRRSRVIGSKSIRRASTGLRTRQQTIKWIHVDPERALRESPFGGPIAHGFLTLSLIVALLGRTIELRQRAIVNYGLNRVRFIAPVRAGARVRARFQVMNAFDVEGEGVQVVWGVTLEIEDGDKPAGVVEFITRHYF